MTLQALRATTLREFLLAVTLQALRATTLREPPSQVNDYAVKVSISCNIKVISIPNYYEE